MVKIQLHSLKQVRFRSVVLYGALFSVCVVWFFQSQQNQSSLFSKFAKSKPINYWQFEVEETPQQTTMIALDPILNEDKLKTALEKAQTEEFNIVVWEPPFGAKADPSYTDASQCGKCLVTQDKSKVDDPKTKAVIFHFNEASMSNIPQNRCHELVEPIVAQVFIGGESMANCAIDRLWNQTQSRAPEGKDVSGLPKIYVQKIRRPDQLYVWWTMESSVALLHLRGLTLKEFDNFFNLTSSHRRDSGVYTPYGTAENIWNTLKDQGSGDVQKDIDLVVSQKTNLAIWIVSNCGSTNGARARIDIIQKLIDAGLKVDRRGQCFPNNGSVDNRNIIRKYKFYLSFENGYHCVDYLTEKLFYNGFLMEAVPVVWGAKKSDYLAVVPPYSCIFVEDYKTPAELVKYLNYLAQNDTAYKEYFMWRTKNVTDMPQYGRTLGNCQLCRIIHGINIDDIYNPNYDELKTYVPMFGYPNKSMVVPSLGKWYYDTENKECLEKNKPQNYFSRLKVIWQQIKPW